MHLKLKLLIWRQFPGSTLLKPLAAPMSGTALVAFLQPSAFALDAKILVLPAEEIRNPRCLMELVHWML